MDDFKLPTLQAILFSKCQVGTSFETLRTGRKLNLLVIILEFVKSFLDSFLAINC